MSTGYATISRNILNGLSDEFEVHFQAHNYLGQSIPANHLSLADGFPFKFHLHGGGREPYSKDLIQQRCKEIQADVFCVLLDSFMLYPWIMNMNFNPAKTLMYFPSDGEGQLPQNCEQVLNWFNYPVAMAKFGQEQSKVVHDLDTGYIPHAVDHNLFRPLSKEEKLAVKQAFVVNTCSGTLVKGFLADKYVVGIVARNQGRKMLDRAVKAFSKWVKSYDVPDACLYIHTDIYDAAAVFDIVSLVRREGIENRVVFSPIRYFQNFEYEQMNQLYNTFDTFLLPTSGEGFGVPTIEAMSCEIPVIVTDVTTTKELVLDNGVCGKAVPVQTFITGNWNVDRAIVDLDPMVKALNDYYKKPKLRQKHGREGRKKVIKHYSWDVVIQQWKKLLWSIVKNER